MYLVVMNTVCVCVCVCDTWVGSQSTLHVSDTCDPSSLQDTCDPRSLRDRG